MKTTLFIFTALAMAILTGCASSKSYVMVGERHPAVNPSQVKIYTHPPAKYEEVAWMKGSFEWALANPPSDGMTMIRDDFRTQAAKLGANGLLVLRHSELTPAGTGDGSSGPVVVKEPSCIAIYVTQE